jgi:hypothetical protein
VQASQIPVKFPIPFADAAGAGYVRTIPVASQIPTTPGAASLTDGFPPLNFVPVGSGGIPPFGEDMNGILKQITQWLQWDNAGGMVGYDATFSSAIGGYPAGAFILAAAGGGAFWLCTVDNNTSNPDTGGAGWQAVVIEPATAEPKPDGTGAVGSSLKYAREDHVHPNEWCGVSTGTANAQTITPDPAVPALAAGVGLRFKVGAALTNTGAATLTVGALGTFPLRRRGPAGLAALAGGELVAGEVVAVTFDGATLQIDTVAQGTAGAQNASSATGTLAAVTGGPVTVGNIPTFTDTAGTVGDSGASPGSLSSSAVSVYYTLGLSN